ncbi:glycosyltransferase family 2 protein [Patescibacteria group bacterium]|nr:glycosyltransferase family 2 protein [Patescibacteria group bacterium]
MKKLSELSLFLPAYNEEKVISQTIIKSDAILRKVAKKYEILVVNDGSTDRTEEVVNQIIKKNPNVVRMITHNPNKGYGGALKTGLYGSKYKYISFIDADGQFDFAEIGKFIKYINDYDLVIGYRQNRADSGLRIGTAYLLKLWNLFWFKF